MCPKIQRCARSRGSFSANAPSKDVDKTGLRFRLTPHSVPTVDSPSSPKTSPPCGRSRVRRQILSDPGDPGTADRSRMGGTRGASSKCQTKQPPDPSSFGAYSHARCAAIARALLPIFRRSYDMEPDKGGWTLRMWASSTRRSGAPRESVFSLAILDHSCKNLSQKATQVLRASHEDLAYICMLVLNAWRSPQAWALFHAIGHKHAPASRPLPKPCWPIDAVDPEGRNVLHMALENCHPDFVIFLLNEGVPIGPDARGVTPLHQVTRRWQYEKGMDDLIDRLLTRGASVSHQDNMGKTPLHWAAMAGCVSAAEKLLAAGADPMTLDSDGATPLDEASEAGHPELAALLLHHQLMKLDAGRTGVQRRSL